jgi:hypothetical protein
MVALELNKFNSNLESNHLFIKMCMSSHVGPIVVGGFPQEKEVIPEELGGQQRSSIVDTNTPFEQGNPRCI